VRDTSLDLLSADMLNTCLLRSFILTRCCVLYRATKILKRTMLNVHAGRRFSAHALHQWEIQLFNL